MRKTAMIKLNPTPSSIQDLIECVMMYLKLGLSCIPLTTRKVPKIPWKRFQVTRPALQELDSIFAEAEGVGIVCGLVSGNLEVIDIDCKYDRTGRLWENFSNAIMEALPDLYPQLLIAETINGGYHIYYRCHIVDGNRKLASRETHADEKTNINDKNRVLIETRGEGGYVVAPPSPGYRFIQNDINKIPHISEDDRLSLLSIAKSFNEITANNLDSDMGLNKNSYVPIKNSPFDDFNQRCDPLDLLLKHGWQKVRDDGVRVHLRRPGKQKGESGNYLKEKKLFYCFSSSTPFEAGRAFNPVGVFTILEANGDYTYARKLLLDSGYGTTITSREFRHEETKFMGIEIQPYIRVGDDYYKDCKVVRANGQMENKYIPTARQTIIDDHDRRFLYGIPKYDRFCCVPNHIDYQSVIGTNFNIYSSFRHEPKFGKLPIWTLRLLNHVFGDQIHLGLDYIHLLYQYPTQILPILCLVSKENGTGKTTFLNWLNELFMNNMVIIGNQDLESGFNGVYSNKLIVAVDESKIDKGAVLEKIKSLATAKTITVNEKYIKPYTLDFFGKIILCSNYEENFITAKNEDIRYWIRKLGQPRHMNHNIEEELIKEIPYFLGYLQKRGMKVVKKQSRMWFKPEDIYTEELGAVREYSKTGLSKELRVIFEDFFYDEAKNLDQIEAAPVDIKKWFFYNNNQVTAYYITKVLKDDFRLSPQTLKKYDVMGQGEKKTGRPYLFKREYFVNESDNDNSPPDEKMRATVVRK